MNIADVIVIGLILIMQFGLICWFAFVSNRVCKAVDKLRNKNQALIEKVNCLKAKNINLLRELKNYE